MKKCFVFDFDSTLTQVEALDVLAEISLEGNPRKTEIIEEIKQITDKGIDGTISFTESLENRIKLLEAHQDHLKDLVSRLSSQVSESFERNKSFFDEHKDDVYVISCGFKEFIDPIVKAFNIESERVFANTFQFAQDGKIVGFDSENVLSQHNGKIDCLRNLNLPGEIHVIGDGYSDYVMKEAGVAHKFFAFTENVERNNILDKADHITPNLDEFLFVNDLPRTYSYPRHRIKILLLENIHPDAYGKLTKEGFNVELLPNSLDEDELCEKIKGVHVLGIRSKTKITPRVLESADKLMAIGAFCIGTKQIDLDACMERGVAVFNAPYSNSRSVVELAIGEIIMLMRTTFQRSSELHSGQWFKTAKGSREIRGKKLGIIGYGNIGTQLSVLAENLGMDVHYYDINEKLAIGNATKCESLDDVLAVSDIISVHIDDNSDNKNFIGEKEFAKMKDGVVFINLSRGFVVDIDALAAAIRSGKVGGAAVDVFPVEPKKSNAEFETVLKGLPNVILTPHVGGSTEEAQSNIAEFVPRRLANYINSGNTMESVNFPEIKLPGQKEAHRFLHVHKNVPGIMGEINSILADYKLNILGQYLKTNDTLGYLITDVDKNYSKDVIEKLKVVEHTLKFRVLY